MSKYNSRHLNRTAGTSRDAKEARGRHSTSRTWKSGDNWVECQRCGHDIYSSDAREDGYTRGLIVCPKCYDAPHPQDYVRAYEDRISPAGFVTGAVTDNVVGLAGSTSNPYSTSQTQFVGTRTPVSDQTDDAGATISTLVTSGCFNTSYWDQLRNESITISSYSVTGLPSGLSMSTSTGDITGTIGQTEYDSSPFSVVVTAHFASGYTQTCGFTWTVNNAGCTPDQVAGLVLWWDMSDAEAVWANEARSTPITDGTLIRGCTDLSGNGHHGETESDGNAMRWDNTTTRNGLAVADADIEGANPRHLNTGPGDSLGLTQPYTCIATVQIPTADETDSNVCMSHRGIDGTQLEQARDTDGGVSRLYTIVSSSIGEISDGDGLGDNTTEWYMIVMQVNGDDSWVTFNNLAETGQAEHDTNTENNCVSYRFAAGTDTSANIRSGWNAPVGETFVYNAALTSTQLTCLYTSQKAKWALTDEING